MGFLTGLGQVINEQFGFGQNSSTNIDTKDGDGRVVNFGKLGDFAAKFDQSAQRTYIEDGLIRNIRPRMREVLWQQPDIAVIFKKRMFSSLAENFRPELSEESEKLFIRASKRLFQNKCRAITLYEKLTKIEALARENGQVNSYMFPMLVSGFSELESIPILNNIIDDKTKNAIEQLRRVFAFSEPTQFTTWAIDNDSMFTSELGEGTGTIELTTVANINTKSSVRFGNGNASLTIEDPYSLMLMTEDDIDAAISDAVNYFKNGAFGRFTEIETRNLIEQQKQELNRIRAGRGVSNIRFIISTQADFRNSHTTRSDKFTAVAGNKVVAIVEAEGLDIKFIYNPGLAGIDLSISLTDGIDISQSEAQIDPSDLIAEDGTPSVRLGTQGLTEREATLFKEIIRNTFLYLGFLKETNSQTHQFNIETNFVRNKMRLHYAGKYLVQAMDVVNIFMTSKTQPDQKITQGFAPTSSGQGLNVGNLLNSLTRNINGFFGGSNNDYEEVEKAFVVGPDFPTWLWRLFRNDFTKQGAGTTTFVGVVTSVTQTYSTGKYIITVNCEDNSYYFKTSQINITPALDVYNGALYDPLTPFNISFDAATGTAITDVQQGQIPELLQENKILLNSEAVKFKTGRLRGTPVSEEAFKSQNVEFAPGGFRNVLFCPDGFVYRWKEGIGSLVKNERVVQSSIIDEKPIRLTANPFAGQDVMNVLSLLITGTPYNYNSFLKAAIANANGEISRDNNSNQNSAKTYLDAITDDLTKRNQLWGNFIPFKKLVMSESANAFVNSGQNDFITRDLALNDLIRQRAALMDELKLQELGFTRDVQVFSRDENGQLQRPSGDAPLNPKALTIQNEINKLTTQIETAKQNFSANALNLLSSHPEGSIKILGDDISLSPDITDGNANATTEEQRQLDRDEFRRRINFLTQRRLWKVKANEDVNLFVIDDQYDRNWDIQGFERKIGNAIQLFNSEYVTIDGQIQNTASILGLEVFADTQGHIQARPPQYNRVPSSVFYKMFKDKHRTGVQVFPKYLESLFFNQIQGLINQIEIVESEIRLRAAVLGYFTDKSVSQLISGPQSLDSSGVGFQFASDGSTFRIGDDNFKKLIQQAKPDLNEELINGPLKATASTLSAASQATVLFSAITRENILNNQDFTVAQDPTNRLSNIREFLQRQKGIQAPTERDLISNDRFRQLNNGKISNIDALNILNQIAPYVGERQKLMLTAVGAIRNLSDGVLLNKEDQGANSALFPQLNRKQVIPDILEHMIEDETLDDFGPGSGKRFVIRDVDIISMTIQETPPEYTTTQVNGLFSEGIIPPPSSLGLQNSGNVVTSAFAVDYDMWRMYGFRAKQPVEAPFFNDPETQCAPYAVYLLNLARKNIFQGTIVVTGNEYYQPGDVVYIEGRGLLFYVEDVSHSFSYGSTFQTTLTIKYGHNPGEYIPTILDIVGKSLYGTRNLITSFRNSRFDNSNGAVSTGVVIYNNSASVNFGDVTIEQVINGMYGNQNQKVLFNSLFSLSGAVNPAGFRNTKPTLELRIYYSSNNAPANEELINIAETIKTWLANPSRSSITPNQPLISVENKNGSFKLPNDSINIVTVDISDTDNSPSGSAWDSVRRVVSEIGSQLGDSSLISSSITQNEVLFTHIIDCWLAFVPVEESAETTVPGAGGIGEAAQAAQAAIDDARKQVAQGRG